MSDKDTVTKEFMQDSAFFADAFNFLMYNGREVIDPRQLKPIDTASIVLPFADGKQSIPVQKYRDVLKLVTAMEDGNTAYLILGIENQSQIHYAMPVRNMLYDAMQYVAQVDSASKRHRSNERHAPSGAEYLSGFYRSDRLIPVITLTLYFNDDKWTVPRDLHSMLSANDDVLRYVDNYHLHLIVPAEIEDEEFTKFHTELRVALKYVKYCNDRQNLDRIIHEDDDFTNVSRQTANTINTVTGTR